MTALVITMLKVALLFLLPLMRSEENQIREFPSDLLSSENILPYSRPIIGPGLPYGGALPGLFGLGLHGLGGLHSAGALNGGYNGLGAAGHGFHGGNLFGKQGFSKGVGGGGYGLQNGFGGVFGTKGGFGDQFIGGNSNTFAKEKVFSQNKNFGSGVKGGFGAGYGAQGAHNGLGGYGGFGGLGGFGTGGAGGQGLYAAGGVGGGGFGHYGHNLGSLHGKGVGAAG
ncbi:uncharacterized protein LOC129231120 [Uloborus diversus]|uniref:uncharacterized protein LOC129231120 n=1 Tax=Uloborus diversus TaxID=327109 RepID=UPI00240A51EF|nr:uncharacterized protein LOC129231120 [Uloborus diversus]